MSKIFNSTFEISLRVLLILQEVENSYLSSDMITSIDFITVYGYDFGISNTNLHGNNLFKYSEFATRRILVKDAIKNLVLRGLVHVECGENGFCYTITAIGQLYCDSLNSDYANTYRLLVSHSINYTRTKSEKDVLNLINHYSIQSLRREEN